MKKKQLIGSLLLLLTATIWGSAFVAQAVGLELVGTFTFSAARCFLGFLALLPVIAVLDRMKQKNGQALPEKTPEGRKTLLKGGVACGFFLFAASNMQQIGIQYTTVGKAGFITALYIIMVPILGLFLKKKVSFNVWISVVLALAGLYLLSMKGNMLPGKGDLCVLLCALLFSFHILVVDHFSPLTDGVKMSCIQFLVCGLLSAVMMVLVEKPQLTQIWNARTAIVYAGVMSCGVAYTLQIVGQKDLDPTIAALIMSLESVISAISGWLLLGQVLSGREILGCVITFAAIVLAQLPVEAWVKRRQPGR
ncbi:MAG: DMT family transporter [Lachnospiraceae bacterium]|nr:DMT family transporter [Lachnospiraceae bacterium]